MAGCLMGQKWGIENNFKKDIVNNPSHYTFGNVECIDAIESSMSKESFCGFLKGNVMKYVWRYEHKGRSIEDLEKCKWYLNKLIEIRKELENDNA